MEKWKICSSGANVPFFLLFSKNLTFQRRPKALVLSKGITNKASWTLGSSPEYDYGHPIITKANIESIAQVS